jgi:site-specific recombinase XerD
MAYTLIQVGDDETIGADVRKGHKSVETTMIYTHVVAEITRVGS